MTDLEARLLQALEELVAEFDTDNEEASLAPGIIGWNDTFGIELAREAIDLADPERPGS